MVIRYLVVSESGQDPKPGWRYKLIQKWLGRKGVQINFGSQEDRLYICISSISHNEIIAGIVVDPAMLPHLVEQAQRAEAQRKLVSE